jgi:osmotically-inducible protein OsmY
MTRSKIFLGLLSLAAATAALVACGSSDEGSFQSKDRPVGVGNTVAANAQLEESVREKLAAHRELSDANLRVVADVTRNEVTLSGTVSSEALREQAIELAKSAQVGVIVRENIAVRTSASSAS